MRDEDIIALFFLAVVVFMLFGAPYLAQKQAELTIAKWEREEKENE